MTTQQASWLVEVRYNVTLDILGLRHVASKLRVSFLRNVLGKTALNEDMYLKISRERQ